MPNFTFSYQGSIYSEEQIRLGEVPPALSFCKEYLSDQEVFKISSSGSTGNPKTYEINKTQLKSSAMATASFFKLKEGDHALICLDTSRIAGIMMLVRTMEIGLISLVIDPKRNPFEELSNENNFDFTALAPIQLQTIKEESNKTFLSTFINSKGIIIGGAPVSQELVNYCRNSVLPFYGSYGMTETVSHIALRKLGKENFYTLLPNIAIDVDDRSCLQIRGEITDDKLIQTNDIVQIENKKQFEWIGRYDFVINTGGHKVSPERIERIYSEWFQKTDFINQFFVSSIADSFFGEKIIIIFEKEAPDLPSNQFLLQFLSPYEIPKQSFVLESFIFTETEKINRPQTLLLIN